MENYLFPDVLHRHFLSKNTRNAILQLHATCTSYVELTIGSSQNVIKF